VVLNPMIRDNIFIRLIALGALASTSLGDAPAHGDLLAIRVGRAETIANGTIENAVILVDGGEIVAVGEDLPIERGIEVLDRPGWTVMPGLVNCYSRAGMEGSAGSAFTPAARASGELYARQEIYGDLLELGVTTLGLYPPGTGVAGQAVAIKPHGSSPAEMILADGVYLKAYLQSTPGSLKMLRKGFAEVDKYEEKVEKAREKWEKAQEKKKKKKKKSKKDEDKKEGTAARKDTKKKKSDEAESFTPPAPEEGVKPFLDLRQGKLPALFRIQKAGDYLHLLGVIEDEKDMTWCLRVPLRNDIDLYHVADRMGERELNVVLDPRITFQPNSMRERNIPAEVAASGAHVALIPLSDNVSGTKRWLSDIGTLISKGLDRDDALSAVTQIPADVLGLGDRLGSLEKGKDANLVFYDGDPFEPSSKVQAVMLEGTFVFERDDR